MGGADTRPKEAIVSVSEQTKLERDERRPYSVDEVAAILGIARGSAYEAVRRGDIPSIRVGKRILVPRARLHAMLGETSG